MQVASTLRMKQVFSCPYYPHGNGCFENVHNFLKMCLWKHVSSELVWDEVVYIAFVAYNFVPNEHSKEFERDAYTPFVQLLNPRLRYVDNDRSKITPKILMH